MPQIISGHTDIAGTDAQQPAEHPEGGAFPGAVGTEQTENLAAPDIKSETFDRFEIAESFFQIPGLDHHFLLNATLEGFFHSIDLKTAFFVGNQGHKGIFKGRRGALNGCRPVVRQRVGHGPDAVSIGYCTHPPGSYGRINNMRLSHQIRVYLASLDARCRLNERNILSHPLFEFFGCSFSKFLSFMEHHHVVASFGLVQIGGREQDPDTVFFHQFVNDFPKLAA